MPDYAPRMDFRRLLSTSTVAFALAGLLVSGCSSGRTPPSTPAGVVRASQASQTSQALKAVPSPGLTSYYGQKLTWHPCGAPGFQCSTMKVPFSYQKPMDGDIKLAVSRKKATGPGKRIGSLLVNPGGPGSSAIQYLQGYAAIGYPAAVRARRTTWWPSTRAASARSQPVECLTTGRWTRTPRSTRRRTTTAEINKLDAAYKRFARGCEKRSAKLLRACLARSRQPATWTSCARCSATRSCTMSAPPTAPSSARPTPDSSRTGSGRLVLDGAMDPSLSSLTLNRDQTAGFETAFKSFATDCITHRTARSARNPSPTPGVAWSPSSPVSTPSRSPRARAAS